MKLTGIFLVAAILHVSAHSTAQTVTYEAKATPLVKVFAEVERQTGFVFFYDKQDLQGAIPVTVTLKDVPMKEALEAILAKEPIGFDIQGNTIVITLKAPVVGVNTNNTVAIPPADIHGHITDSLGKPLVGASVMVKGGKNGTMTDEYGNFILKGIDNGATLVVSFLGFETQTVRLTGGNQIRIMLWPSTNILDETVVKGYYTTTKRLNTGDVSTVKGEDIQKQPVTDPILALEGRVPGLYIQQKSGSPGAYSTISIRGKNSMSNGNDPLYIVDGVPFSSVSLSTVSFTGGSIGSPTNVGFNQTGGGMSPFNSLNPADIESVEVLKDADATAIYGSRGANGVILITTKKGKQGNTHFDLDVYTGEGKPSRTIKLLNTPQYLAMRREAIINDGKPLPSIVNNPTNTDYDVNGFWDSTRYTNWQKVLIGNPAHLTNAQGSLSGGDANTQFVLGGGYSKQGTVFPGNYTDQKASAHFNLSHVSSNQRFHALMTANYVNDNSRLPVSDFTSRITLAPDAPALYDANGNLNWQLYKGATTFSNPLGPTLQRSTAVTNNLISDLSLGYEIIPGLQLKSSFGYNRAEMNQTEIAPASSYAPPNNTNPNFRSYATATTTFATWIIEPQLNYKKRIGAGQLEAIIGSTFQQNSQNTSALDAYGYSSDALITSPIAGANVLLLGANDAIYRYNAAYGRISYNWKDKYIVNFTGRRDGSSRFGPGKQFGNFGATGVGWIFSKEKFIENTLPFLSFGKLRGSYGITGNDQIGDYQYLSTYTPVTPTYEAITGLIPTSLTNPYFAWEVVKKIEGGVDIGLLKDRILLSVSYYRNRTGNQLIGQPLPSLTGFSSIQFNLPAIVQNTGVEITLNTTNIKTKSFSWTTSANLSVPRNKLVAFPNIANYPSYNSLYVVGQSLFIRKLYHSTGVNPQAGVYSFATKNSNGLPSAPQDQVATRALTQRFYGGILNSFSYKGFQLDIFVIYVNQLTTSVQTSFAYPGSVNSNEPVGVLGRWQSPGNLTAVQRFGTTSTTSTPFSYWIQSDNTIVNGSFVRVKNLALSYQLPGEWMTKVHLKNTRLYVQCQNLLTFTSYKGLDPETGGLGLPPLRMITTGLQIGL